MTDIEISHSVDPAKIETVASKLGLKDNEYYKVGRSIAKVDIVRANNSNSKLVLVTSINPTKAGNGKTTVSIGLADALAKLNKKVCLALREPSLGPVFGMKGGATGGGYSQVIPMEEINLHFTGDFHAITTANNLLCSAIDNHIFQGNLLDIDTNKIMFNRCLDLNDRALRNVIVESETNNARKEKFNITAASEIMAIVTVCSGIDDLKRRIGNILIAFDKKSNPVYAKQLKIEDAMTIILKEAIKPNIVQTLASTPALIHGGPFANIAHGCNSIIATKTAMSMAEYTITEAGFGADLGAEKFIDYKCRLAKIKPNSVVIVATIPALKLHGGVKDTDLENENLEAVEKGFANLKKHIDNIKNVFNVPCVVTLNQYITDTDKELELIARLVADTDTSFEINEVWAKGGDGAINLAKAVIKESEKDYTQKFVYDLNDSIEEKIDKVARKIYGAEKVTYSQEAIDNIKLANMLGLDNLPIIIAKTQYSLSDDKDLLGAPTGFEIKVRDIEFRTGAGFIVVLLGKMLLMPGLNKTPAYEKMQISSNGDISGMY